MRIKTAFAAHEIEAQTETAAIFSFIPLLIFGIIQKIANRFISGVAISKINDVFVKNLPPKITGE